MLNELWPFWNKRFTLVIGDSPCPDKTRPFVYLDPTVVGTKEISLLVFKYRLSLTIKIINSRPSISKTKTPTAIFVSLQLFNHFIYVYASPNYNSITIKNSNTQVAMGAENSDM